MSHLLMALLLASSPGRGHRVTEPVLSASVGVAGDSIAYGVCSRGIAQALRDHIPAGYVTSNAAVSGWTAHQIATRLSDMSQTSTMCLGLQCGTYVAEGGVNTLKDSALVGKTPGEVASIALNGDADSGTLGMIQGIDAVHAHHPRAKVIAVGVLDYGGCTFCNTDELHEHAARVATYNTALQTACAARAPWLSCTFPAADFADPANPGFINPSLACEDKIHLSVAGADVLGAHVYGAHSWP